MTDQFCTGCGAPRSPSAKFCTSCGQLFVADQQPQQRRSITTFFPDAERVDMSVPVVGQRSKTDYQPASVPPPQAPQTSLPPADRPAAISPSGTSSNNGTDSDAPPPNRRRSTIALLVVSAAIVVFVAVAFGMILGGSNDDDKAVTNTPGSSASQSLTNGTSSSGIQRTVPADVVEYPDGITFKMPSSNIACAMSVDEVECSIRMIEVAAEGSSDECPQSWGKGFVLTGESTATRGCGNDAVFDDVTATAEYGQSFQSGSMVCASSRQGIECWNTETQHGFSVARRQADTF